jgi:integrase
LKKPKTQDEAFALLRLLEIHGGLRATARAIDMPHTTLQNWVRGAKRIIDGDHRPGYRKKRKTSILIEIIEMLGGRCELCKKQFAPHEYDFHHKDPSKKEFSVGDLTGSSINRAKKEATKCALLCSNCHRTAHYVHNNLFINNRAGEK